MIYIPKIIKPGFARRMHLLHILLLLQNTKSINTKISLFHKTKTQTYIIYQIFSKSRHLNWQFSEEKKNCKKILSLKAPSINSLNLFLWKHGHLKSIDVSINYLCWKEQKNFSTFSNYVEIKSSFSKILIFKRKIISIFVAQKWHSLFYTCMIYLQNQDIDILKVLTHSNSSLDKRRKDIIN